MGVDDKAEDSTGTAKEATDWSGPGDEGPEESALATAAAAAEAGRDATITFGAGKSTDDEEPEAEGKAD
jgi:hypothetical protein